jgi:hypothetical protein
MFNWKWAIVTLIWVWPIYNMLPRDVRQLLVRGNVMEAIEQLTWHFP